MPTFPLEIIEAIIDLLEDDPLSLRSCRLSCSALSPRCRRLLFRTVRLDTRQQLNALVASIQRDPTLGDLIHKIIIPPTYRPEYLIASSITELTLKLPNLSSLHVVGRSYNSRVHQEMLDHRKVSLQLATLACLKSYSSVRELCLCEIEFSNYVQFARVLTSLSSVRHLRCLAVSCRRLSFPSQIVMEQYFGRLRLHTLAVSIINVMHLRY